MRKRVEQLGSGQATSASLVIQSFLWVGRCFAGNAVIGPMLIGMEKPVQIAAMTSIAPDILTLAVLAAGGVVG